LLGLSETNTIDYYVSTVGRDEAVIREYIRTQEAEDRRLDQMDLW
jgi:putative transposase